MLPGRIPICIHLHPFELANQTEFSSPDVVCGCLWHMASPSPLAQLHFEATEGWSLLPSRGSAGWKKR